MASFLPKVLTVIKFNDFDLLMTTVANHFSGHFSASDQRRANLNLSATDHQNPIEFDSFTCGHFNFFQFKGLALNDTVLLATAFYYCVHSALRLISLPAFKIIPCKSRGQSQAQTVELTLDDCNQAQHRPEGGDFTQIGLAEQGLIFHKNKELRLVLVGPSTHRQLDRSVGAP
jgi:hypothetical protein